MTPARAPTPRASPSTVRSGSAPAIAAGTDAILRRSSASCAPWRPTLRGLPWLREAVLHRLAGAGWGGQRRPGRSRPAPGVSRQGPYAWLQGQSAAAAAAHACFRRAGSRSTSTPTTDPSGCAASTSASACWCCSTATAGCTRSIHVAPFPGHDPAGLDRDPPDLLGLLAGRPSGRARACHGRHPLRRPVRRHLRRRPPAQRTRAAHLSRLPPAPIAMAHACVNLVQSLAIVLRERPQLVLSPVPTSRCRSASLPACSAPRLVFIETAGELAPTLAGRLVYPFADLFIVQWPEKLRPSRAPCSPAGRCCDPGGRRHLHPRLRRAGRPPPTRQRPRSACPASPRSATRAPSPATWPGSDSCRRRQLAHGWPRPGW